MGFTPGPWGVRFGHWLSRRGCLGGDRLGLLFFAQMK